jgi:spermidine synthase
VTGPLTRRLGSSGVIATIEPDPFQAGAYILDVDGTPQSHIVPEHPDELFFEYIRRMGHVIDVAAPTGEAITAIHLGAGALTLPRYIEATRPGSRQQVIDIDRDLVDFVREVFPLPSRASIRLRYGDAREVINKLPAGLRASADVITVDIFAGARTPAHVTTVEFFTEVAALLAPTGVVIINIADGPGLAYARGQVATVAHVFAHVGVMAEAQVLKGRRFGNLVLVASNRPDVLNELPRLMARGPHPASSMSGAELTRFMGGALLTTDATAVPSPTPQKTIFQMAKKS